MFTWLFRIFATLYLLALALWLIGTLGLFGQEQDPLSGVFLILLGQPWVRLVDLLPERIWPIASALMPAINAGILYALAVWRKR